MLLLFVCFACLSVCLFDVVGVDVVADVVVALVFGGVAVVNTCIRKRHVCTSRQMCMCNCIMPALRIWTFTDVSL